MPDLFDLLDCHTHDPETSRAANERMESSGAKARHSAMVLAMVKRLPGSTAIELWDGASDGEQATLKEPQEVRRRLVNLERAGLVRKAEARPCRVRGSRQTTWVAV